MAEPSSLSPGTKFSVADVRSRSLKKRDSWWTILFVDPVAIRLCVLIANRTSITPDQLTVSAFLLGLVASWFFWQATNESLVIGAIIYHISFTLDCVDGKLARLKGTGSLFGSWLDWTFDRFRVFATSLALMTGQYELTGNQVFLYLAALVIFLDMLRYIDALMISKIQMQMKQRIVAAKRAMRIALSEDDLAAETGQDDEDVQDVVRNPISSATVRGELQREFKARFPWYLRIRDQLMSWRVRPHLFSGIEYQMFVFILGPVSGQIVGFTVASSALLVMFEIVILYKLHLSLRDMERLVTKIHTGEFEVPPKLSPPSVVRPDERRTQ